MANVNRKKSSKAFQPHDFFPALAAAGKKKRPAKQKTPDEMLAVLKQAFPNKPGVMNG
jgi:hypothetical protein